MIAYLALVVACVALILTIRREVLWMQVQDAVQTTEEASLRIQHIANTTMADVRKLVELREEAERFGRKDIERRTERGYL